MLTFVNLARSKSKSYIIAPEADPVPPPNEWVKTIPLSKSHYSTCCLTLFSHASLNH